MCADRTWLFDLHDALFGRLLRNFQDWPIMTGRPNGQPARRRLRNTLPPSPMRLATVRLLPSYAVAYPVNAGDRFGFRMPRLASSAHPHVAPDRPQAVEPDSPPRGCSHGTAHRGRHGPKRSSQRDCRRKTINPIIRGWGNSCVAPMLESAFYDFRDTRR